MLQKCSLNLWGIAHTATKLWGNLPHCPKSSRVLGMGGATGGTEGISSPPPPVYEVEGIIPSSFSDNFAFFKYYKNNSTFHGFSK